MILKTLSLHTFYFPVDVICAQQYRGRGLLKNTCRLQFDMFISEIFTHTGKRYEILFGHSHNHLLLIITGNREHCVSLSEIT